MTEGGAEIWSTISLTLELAGLTTVLLIVFVTPLAWALARSSGWWAEIVSAVVALPLVLPPTVLGFYLLLALAPQGLLSRLLAPAGIAPLAFTFPGLVLGSMIYSLPFAVQPLRDGFRAIGEKPLMAAATLGANPIDTFFSVALPLARRGLISASVLTFAHTIGEFGVVLMIGGNIPGATRVLSIAIFDHVEASEWHDAHLLAGGLVLFAFLVILILQRLGRAAPRSAA